MSVTIADSVGYEGTVEEPEWARLMAYAGGRQYGVIGEGDWKVTVGTADREVRIAPGSGFGSGILDRTTVSASLTLPAVSSGSKWHLIAARRDWSANESTFDSIAGGTGTAQIPARNTTPGTADDQPIALARVQAGQSQVAEIIDLRVWGGYGGAFAIDELVLQYLNQLGTRVKIGRKTFSRELNNLGTAVWVTSQDPARGTYVGPTALVSDPVPGIFTVNHDLGSVPSQVFAFDRNAGGGAATRKVVVVSVTATQIQFIVYNNGTPLSGNPVEVHWLAFP